MRRLRVENEALRQTLETPRSARKSASSTRQVETVALAPAQIDSETPTRKELGKLFNVSHEAIRLWEESGKLKEQGWERIPSAGNPVRYRRCSM